MHSTSSKICTKDISIILQDVLNLVDTPAQFHEFIETFTGMNLLQQQRLCKWFRFFTDHHADCVCIYSPTIYALTEIFDNNELFLEQTEHQREISFWFYERLFSLLFLRTSVSNTETAKYLLCITFIYGKYPGMQIRPIAQAAYCLKGGINLDRLNQFFELLFVKYENPKLFTNNLVTLRLMEVDTLMFVLQGNNIRKYIGLPVAISKKDSFLLMNAHILSRFDNHVLTHSIAIIKLMKIESSQEKLDLFYMSCYIFKHRINFFLTYISFWQSVYAFFCKIDWNTTPLSYRDFLEYFEDIANDIFVGPYSYSFKGKTITSLLNDIYIWQLQSHHNKAGLLLLKWKPKNRITKYQIPYGKAIYIFKEILSGQELEQESKILDHCVFFYTYECFKGDCSIWSMKKIKNNQQVRLITIEVQPNGAIVQAAGHQNREPSRFEMNAIQKWARQANFSIEL